MGKYMLRPILALERLTFLEPEGKVGYRWGRDGSEQETEVMDYLEFIARVTSHIPDKGQVMVRYIGLYANGGRGPGFLPGDPLPAVLAREYCGRVASRRLVP